MDEGVHGGNIMTNYNKPAFLIAVDVCVLLFMHIIYYSMPKIAITSIYVHVCTLYV